MTIIKTTALIVAALLCAATVHAQEEQDALDEPEEGGGDEPSDFGDVEYPVETEIEVARDDEASAEMTPAEEGENEPPWSYYEGGDVDVTLGDGYSSFGIGFVLGSLGIHSGGKTAPFALAIGPRLSYQLDETVRFSGVFGPLFAGPDEQGKDPIGFFWTVEVQVRGWTPAGLTTFVPVMGAHQIAAATNFKTGESQLNHFGGHAGVLWCILPDTGVGARFLLGDQLGQENTGASMGWMVAVETRLW